MTRLRTAVLVAVLLVLPVLSGELDAQATSKSGWASERSRQAPVQLNGEPWCTGWVVDGECWVPVREVVKIWPGRMSVHWDPAGRVEVRTGVRERLLSRPELGEFPPLPRGEWILERRSRSDLKREVEPREPEWLQGEAQGELDRELQALERRREEVEREAAGRLERELKRERPEMEREIQAEVAEELDLLAREHEERERDIYARLERRHLKREFEELTRERREIQHEPERPELRRAMEAELEREHAEVKRHLQELLRDREALEREMLADLERELARERPEIQRERVELEHEVKLALERVQDQLEGALRLLQRARSDLETLTKPRECIGMDVRSEAFLTGGNANGKAAGR